MPTEYSWPRLRAILDESISSPHGIAVSYPDWQTAERVRASMYKIREMQRKAARKTYPDPSHPSHGISAYDGIMFWIKSSISRKDIKITFHSKEEIDIHEQRVSETYKEPTNKRDETADLFPGQCLTMTVTTPMGEAIVEYAPSYKIAWNLLRRDFPCQLILENGYSLENLEITQL